MRQSLGVVFVVTAVVTACSSSTSSPGGAGPSDSGKPDGSSSSSGGRGGAGGASGASGASGAAGALGSGGASGGRGGAAGASSGADAGTDQDGGTESGAGPSPLEKFCDAVVAAGCSNGPPTVAQCLGQLEPIESCIGVSGCIACAAPAFVVQCAASGDPDVVGCETRCRIGACSDGGNASTDGGPSGDAS